MTNRQMFNVSIAFAALTTLVLWVAKTRGADIQAINFIGIAVLVGLMFVSPLIAFVLIVPVSLLAWFRYYKDVLGYLNTFRIQQTEGRQ